MFLEHVWPTKCTELPAKCAATHPSVTDPVASICSPAFLEKTSPGRQIFHQVTPFCKVAVLSYSKIHKWYMLVRKSSTWEAINWPSKLKISPGTRKAKFLLGEGEKLTWSGFTGSVTEGCYYLLKWTSFTRQPLWPRALQNDRPKVYFCFQDLAGVIFMRTSNPYRYRMCTC